MVCSSTESCLQVFLSGRTPPQQPELISRYDASEVEQCRDALPRTLAAAR